ncbi:methyl-accepting chemotaxis protein [Marinobacterium arenosum]|uniref:methyl-accepting chemotaxis protein n=1 Tax=Marinobacterium arenosum TaxID=2862496 RepID=UPI001C98140B|nr:methyl-accepting chemotaxis protein [Marinobacterium arenosum]MBY4675251.1 methyl-accepting chemotaxis protein [Marinobacterium arenosum]
MKILHRILIAPALAVLFLVLCGLVAFDAISRQQSAMDEINNVRFAHLTKGAAVADQIAQVHTDMFRLVSWYNAYDEATQNAMKAKVGKDLASITEQLSRWQQQSEFSDQEKAQLEQILMGLASYASATEAAIFMVDLDQTSALGDMRHIERQFIALKELFDGYNNLQAEMSVSLFDTVADESGRATLINLLLVAVAVLISGLVAVATARSLMRQLGGEPAEAVRIARQIAAGDLTEQLAPATEGSILDAVARMQQSLRGMVSTLTDNAHQLADSAEALTQAADTVAQSSGSQSQAASSMSAAIEQLRTSIGEVFHNAQSASETSRESGERAVSGSGIMLDTTRSMELMAEAVKAVSSSVQDLGDKTDRISSVVNVIQGVAEQTNLLALNAAIEAARAGEQGRGFAVVADEVRELAQRAARSTDEISTIIREIQLGVAATSEAMNTSVQQVEEGVALGNEAGDSITRIRVSVEQVLTAVEGISQALQEQTASTDEIADGIIHIAEMSVDNSDRAQASAEEARTVAQLSKNIHSAMGQFRC